MSKLQKLLFGVFILLLAIMVYAEATKPQPVNWFPSYTQMDKIPFGTFVLYNLLEEEQPPIKIESVDIPPFEKLKDTTVKGTYLFINNSIAFDDTELDKLLAWVSTGNTLFVAANSLGNSLKDTLKIDLKNQVYLTKMGTKPMLNLVNKNLQADEPYLIEREMRIPYFDELDTLNQKVLGVTQTYRDTLKITEPEVNFIESSFGKGTIFIHTQPEVFTNYFILEKNHKTYTENVLSYINTNQPILWDMHYKSGKRVNVSPLHILLNTKNLKWAYYIALIGALLFVIFEGKRKQRSIPIIQPLTNKSYQYTQTISGMYIDKKENHEIAKKQIALFLEYVRTHLRVPTEHMNSRFFKTVAARSGNTVEDTQKLFTFIEKVQNQEDTAEAELIKLYTEITIFKDTLDGKS